MKTPDYYLPIMPYLIVENAKAFVSFLKKVFQAEERFIGEEPDGRIIHGEMSIGKATIMFTDATERFSRFPAGMFLLRNDVDALYEKGIDLGCKSLQEPGDRDYGRSAGFEDPFGNQWWLVNHPE